MDTNQHPVTLKRGIAISFAFSAGFALLASLIVILFSWYSSRPQHRDRHALQAKFDLATPSDDFGWAEFNYLLENKTASDYKADSKDLRVLTRRDDGSLALDGEWIKIDPIFVPAGEKGELIIKINYSFSPSSDDKASYKRLGTLKGAERMALRDRLRTKFYAYLNEDLARLSGFAVYDDARHYQIDCPKGWN